MVKICQTGLLTLNFEIIPKKRIFRFVPKISAGHAWSWKIFFANFQILGPLGCQGWVVIPQNVKKSQNHCTLVPMCIIYEQLLWEIKLKTQMIFNPRFIIEKPWRKRMEEKYVTGLLCTSHSKRWMVYVNTIRIVQCWTKRKKNKLCAARWSWRWQMKKDTCR